MQRDVAGKTSAVPYGLKKTKRGGTPVGNTNKAKLSLMVAHLGGFFVTWNTTSIHGYRVTAKSSEKSRQKAILQKTNKQIACNT